MGRVRLSRKFFLSAMIVSVSVLAACGGSAVTVSAPEPSATAAPTATQTGPAPSFAPRQLNLELQGEGPEIVGPITVDTGVMIAFVRYEGEDPFSMTFLGGEKGIVTSIESSPGPYQGERVHSVFEGNGEGLAPGDYTIEIEGNGSWRLRFFQERATTGQAPTITLSGSGDGGGSWLRLDEGEYTMTTSHTGPAGFTVDLFDSLGLPPYRVVQVSGAYQGEDRFTVGGGAPGENPQPGFYAMGVRSEGDWEVSITSFDAP